MDTQEVLTRGVQDILPSRTQLAKLMGKRKITLYQGFDPTNPSLHIGNLVGIRKLAQFQALGHKVIFLIGDFTGMIGDPTGKSAARKKLTKSQVLKNCHSYKKQVGNIINFKGKNKAEIKFNSAWLEPLSFQDITELASHFTVQQMLERDFFQSRISKQKPIHLHEFLYPLMQGYDSIHMGVDLEIGGNDQLFNMLAGRTLSQSLGKKTKFVLTMKLLTDPAGKKMGKTEGNTINLADSAENIYGKFMSLPDNLLELALELLTDLPLTLANSTKPMDLKKQIAHNLVRQISGSQEADKAQGYFEHTFQQKQSPSQVQLVTMPSAKTTVSEALILTKLITSKSEAKRLFKTNSIKVNGEPAASLDQRVKDKDILQRGSHQFAKIKLPQ